MEKDSVKLFIKGDNFVRVVTHLWERDLYENILKSMYKDMEQKNKFLNEVSDIRLEGIKQIEENYKNGLKASTDYFNEVRVKSEASLKILNDFNNMNMTEQMSNYISNEFKSATEFIEAYDKNLLELKAKNEKQMYKEIEEYKQMIDGKVIKYKEDIKDLQEHLKIYENPCAE